MMENADSEEPEKKRLHVNNIPSPMARSSTISPENKSVDAAVLQYQNQKLIQQLDKQKHELHDLEVKIQEVKERQSSYDDILKTANQLWNQLVDDLVLVGVRAEGGQDILQTLDGSSQSCPVENAFLCRLLNVDSVEGGGVDCVKSVEEALSQRHSSTWELLTCLEGHIKNQTIRTEGNSQELHNTEDAITYLNKLDNLMIEEANVLREVVDYLHQKHKEYVNKIQIYARNLSVDQNEIKCLTGELEESLAELEESRRKLVNLRMQKKAASEAYSTVSGAVNGNLSSEKLPDRSMGLQELKESLEESKIMAAERLSELEDAREDNLILSKEMKDLENETKDDKHIVSSRLYNLLNDQLNYWKTEVVRYKTLTESLQAERSYLLRRDKELELKTESTDNAKVHVEKVETRVTELELKLHNAVHEKEELEAKMEEAEQDSGRTDIKEEFSVMMSALSKEMGMVKAQLNRWKDTAQEALSLREEVISQKALLCRKTSEVKVLGDKCAQQVAEIKSLKALVEKLKEEKLELQIFVDMYGQGSYDNRDLMEIQESEHRAYSQAELLKHALEEHNLELRIRAADEAEVACQQRLSTAEAEIIDLRVKLDATERDVHELTEAIRLKDAEAESYISEIETIGQAYEDMQSQNQHLLQQMTERDDYNIKLVSESVKMKQAASTLLAEKQALSKQFQLLAASLETHKERINQSEEQIKTVVSEALNCCQENRYLAVSLERAKWELADAEKELKWLKSAIASSEKEYEQLQRKTNEIQLELDGERDDRKKLEEELKEWNDKISEMTSETGEAAISRLEEEIKDCKAILKCGVCFDRPKEVVIVKCYHLFCNQCIQRNLEIRHRKCPGCGTAFGQNDVRFVKI